MGLNDIKFIKSNGGFGRTLPNSDHKSGLIFLRSYALGGQPEVKPFTQSEISSLEDAETKGLTEALYPREYYQVKEFFRFQKNSILYVAFGDAEAAAYDFEEITALQNFANGELRQIAVITYSALVNTNITLIKAIAESIETAHKPLSILFAGDILAMTLSNLTDLRGLTAPNVTVVIGMDGDNEGKTLFDAGEIVPCIGAALGVLSLAAVNQNIAWVEKFNLAEDELEVPAFANGDLVKETDDTVLTQLNTRGYVFLIKHIGISGTYFNDSHTCDLATSDFAYIENVRTIDKAIRNVRTAILPKLNSPNVLNADGTLSVEAITDWQNRAENALEQMKKDQEISAYAVYIDPAQDIGATSKLVIKITLVVNGVARNVEVEIGYGTV